MDSIILKDTIDSLKSKGLLDIKKYDNGLSVIKYNRKAFFNSSWRDYPFLKELRGLVVDSDYNIVSYPFTKVMNYLQEDANVEPDVKIDAILKINGFMASLTEYKGELLISTTGTLDSRFIEYANSKIFENTSREDVLNYLIKSKSTLIFEICHEEDIHIMDEEFGAYLIGCREKFIGSELMREDDLDSLAQSLNWKRPEVIKNIEFNTFYSTLNQDNDIEGYLIRDSDSGKTYFKLKIDKYKQKKKLMRMGKMVVDIMYSNYNSFVNDFSDDFKRVIYLIVSHYKKDKWLELSDVERKEIIENFLEYEVGYVHAILVRGVSGSGKSSFYSKVLHSDYIKCEADDYFLTTDGEYVFNKDKLSEAHSQCFMKFLKNILDYGNNVAVTNTLTTERELKNYIFVLNLFKINFFSIVIENRHGGINSHGVPAEKLEQMKNKFSIIL